MKLLFHQRFFSWFDRYDIFYETGNTAYTVQGKLSWGHLLHISDQNGEHIATVQQKVLTFLPKFFLYEGDLEIGMIRRELSFFHPRYSIDGLGWNIEGDWLGWNYSIVDESGAVVAEIGKEIWHMTDTYVIDVPDPKNALRALMVVLAIDADKCSNNS